MPTTRLPPVARCKTYEIQGPNPAKTAGAVRCTRDSSGKLAVDGKTFPVCKKHHDKTWTLFVKDGWLYSVNLNAKK
jgi:hypothetical protein